MTWCTFLTQHSLPAIPTYSCRSCFQEASGTVLQNSDNTQQRADTCSWPHECSLWLVLPLMLKSGKHTHQTLSVIAHVRMARCLTLMTLCITLAGLMRAAAVVDLFEGQLGEQV